MLAKSVIFSIIFLFFSSISFAQSSSRNFSEEANSPEFWKNIRLIPVQFLEKTEQANGDISFSALFSGPFTTEKIDFLLLSDKNQDKEATFFQQSEEWEEKIDRKSFLKKFKKDFWLTTYLKTNEQNIIITSHQFKSWQAVKNSFASHPDHARRNVDDLDFWKDMRIAILTFEQIDGHKAYWLFLQPIDSSEPISKSDREVVTLANGQSIYKRMKNSDPSTDFRLMENGLLNLQTNTIFHRQEMENSKARKVLNFTIFDAKLRLKPVVLEKSYFLQNHQRRFWLCFYDSKYQSLVRVVEAPEQLPENKK